MSGAQVGYRLCCGSDVAAKSFTASWTLDRSSSSLPITLPQTSDGITTLQQYLGELQIPPNQILIVLEAIGSYWVRLAVSLHAAGYILSVANPMQVHHWAKSLPRRGKSDPLDARMITQYAVERQPRQWSPPPEEYHQLRQRLTAREGLLAMRHQTRNQLHALDQWPVQVIPAQQAIEQVVAKLDKQIAALDAAIVQVLRDGAWAASAELMQTITGIGPLTTAWVLVLTVNWELCPAAEAATNYAGLTPLERESGTSVRGRSQRGRGGDARLRTAFYRATINAARCNPIIKAFYERLRAAGKPWKVARCAAARKLLCLAYAVVSKRQPFDPSYTVQRTVAG